MPKRVQLRRVLGWRMPANTVKVDRSTPYGNPFFIVHDPDATVLWPGDRTVRPFAVRCYEGAAREDGSFLVAVRRTEEAARLESVRLFRTAHASHLDLAPLRGKDLACWCRPGDPCHADVLLELANR